MRAISSLLLYIDIYCRKINLKIVKYYIAKSYTILYNEYNIKILKDVLIMTSAQRENHIAQINNLLMKYGATKDRWDMYHIGNYKFDTRQINLKIYSGKVKIRSTPMMKIELDSLEELLKIYTKESEK